VIVNCKLGRKNRNFVTFSLFLHRWKPDASKIQVTNVVAGEYALLEFLISILIEPHDT
jgi:hypothetical protein